MKARISTLVFVLSALWNIQQVYGQVTDATQLEFRSNGVPVLGMITLALVSAAVFFFGRSSGIEFIADFERERRLAIHKVVLYAAYGYLSIASVFLFFSIAWVEAYLLAFLSLHSFYNVWIQDRKGLLISIISGVFLELIIMGKLGFLGFNRNVADLGALDCLIYFYGTYVDYHTPRCSSPGFLNFLRLLGLAAIIIQPIAIYFTYSLYDLLSSRSDGLHAGYSSFREETINRSNTNDTAVTRSPPRETSSYQSYQVVEEP